LVAAPFSAPSCIRLLGYLEPCVSFSHVLCSSPTASQSDGTLHALFLSSHHDVGPKTDICCLVARIMKLALPENAKIAKEAKECMQECVSEFISFITSEG
jgi:hypothetical protein